MLFPPWVSVFGHLLEDQRERHPFLCFPGLGDFSCMRCTLLPIKQRLVLETTLQAQGQAGGGRLGGKLVRGGREQQSQRHGYAKLELPCVQS